MKNLTGSNEEKAGDVPQIKRKNWWEEFFMDSPNQYIENYYSVINVKIEYYDDIGNSSIIVDHRKEFRYGSTDDGQWKKAFDHFQILYNEYKKEGSMFGIRVENKSTCVNSTRKNIYWLSAFEFCLYNDANKPICYYFTIDDCAYFNEKYCDYWSSDQILVDEDYDHENEIV